MLLSMCYKGNHTEERVCIFFLKIYLEFCQKELLGAINCVVIGLILQLKLPY